MHDIVIVGAGPAGLLAATSCAEAGLDVLVVEEHARIGEPTHCTGILSLESTDLVKIPDDIVLRRLTRAALVGPAESCAEVSWNGDKEPILVIDRAEFDRRLAEQARAAGAMLKLATRVDRVSTHARSVEVVAGAVRIEAKLLILACGVSYALQRQLDLPLPSQVIHTAQIEVAAEAATDVELHFGAHVAPGGFAWVVPIARDGRPALKIGVMANGDAGTYLQSFLARPAIRARLGAPPSAPLRRLLPIGATPRTYAPRVLVAGDAAGLTKPTTGGGIFYSLLSGSIAAETAVEAIRVGRFDEAFLRRYEQRWRRRLGPEFRVAQWFRGFLTRCSDAELDCLVRVLGTDDVQSLIRSAARFNWHGDLIVAALRQPGVISRVLRSLIG